MIEIVFTNIIIGIDGFFSVNFFQFAIFFLGYKQNSNNVVTNNRHKKPSTFYGKF